MLLMVSNEGNTTVPINAIQFVNKYLHGTGVGCFGGCFEDDVEVHELKKFVNNALKSNTTARRFLFVLEPPGSCIHNDIAILAALFFPVLVLINLKISASTQKP